MKITPDLQQPGADARRLGGDDFRRVRVAADGGTPGAEYAGLFAADGRARRAEPGNMIDIHRRDDRHVSVDGVHGVKPPAHADFQHRDVDFRGLEQIESGEGSELEIGQWHRTARGLDALERIAKLGVGRGPAVNANPFVITNKVRRGIGADLVTRAAQDGFAHHRGRALAVGAGDGDGGVRRAARSQVVEHGMHPVEPELDHARMQRLDPRQPIGKRPGFQISRNHLKIPFILHQTLWQ